MAGYHVIALAAPLLGLFGQGAEPSRSPTTPQASCELSMRAQMPLVERNGRFVTQVAVNGQPLWMLVDTGAPNISLPHEVIEQLGLSQDTNRKVSVRGLAGASTPLPSYKMPFFKVGSDTWWTLEAVQQPDPLTASKDGGPPVMGVLGVSLLSLYDVELDIPDKVMRLYAMDGDCRGHFAPWQGSYQAFRPDRLEGFQYVLPISLDGHKLRAVIDTGANVSSISEQAARKIGAPTTDQLQPSKFTPIDANGLHGASHDYRVRTMTIGDEVRYDQSIFIEHSEIPTFDMLLGLDVLRTHAVWLSYHTDQVFVQDRAH